MEVEYADEALDEGVDAAAWYEARQEQLAHRFLRKWKEAENRVAADPVMNVKFTGEFRRCRFDVFSYALVYRIKFGSESLFQSRFGSSQRKS